MSIPDTIMVIGILIALLVLFLEKLGWWDKFVEELRSIWELVKSVLEKEA